MPWRGPTEARPSPTPPLEHSLSPLSLYMITAPLATLDLIKWTVEVHHHGGFEARSVYLDTGVLHVALQEYMKSVSQKVIDFGVPVSQF